MAWRCDGGWLAVAWRWRLAGSGMAMEAGGGVATRWRVAGSGVAMRWRLAGSGVAMRWRLVISGRDGRGRYKVCLLDNT